MLAQPEPEVLDKRDLEDMLENEAARLIAEGQEVNGGIVYRFYMQQREKRKFKPTVSRRQVNNWLKKWNQKGGPRPRTDSKDRIIDGGEY